MGKGESEFITLWNDWLKSNVGRPLLTLIQGAPIVCANSTDTLNVLVTLLNGDITLRKDLIINELLVSIKKLSKTCGVVPDISSKIDELINSKDFFIANNAEKIKKSIDF